ncbi:MAG: hypothetical protein HOI35_14310 [Woeseia sp.]|jgi:hypothetical protein|nr:hypothetical protein [Woeseia sp.]MBT6211177.1 hypothetical protein [Woeseia sp.]
MEDFVQTIEGSAINELILGSAWLWPVMEILHFIGLSILLGALLIIDLRLAGFFRKIDIAATHKLLPWVFAGFGINLTTGILFVLGDPYRYTANIGFWWKMGLVGVAGLNALWFWWKINPVMQSWEPHADTPALAKVIAWVSLGSWFGVLLLGRLIPYIGTG